MRMPRTNEHILVPPSTPGRIRIHGRVLDGERQPVEDALVEIWQADPSGKYCHPSDRWPPAHGGFTGFGRAGTNRGSGAFVFETLRPGRVPGPGGTLQAPHVSLVLQA